MPTGDVTFYVGGLAVGRSALDGGVAAAPVRSLAKGTHLVTASYAGDGTFVAAAGALAGGQVVADSAPVAGAGQAAGFDGLAQYARAEDPEGALDGVLTVELWFEAAPATGAAAACLVQQGEGDLVRFGLCLSAARDRLVVRRGFETTFIPVEITPGWHRLALASGPVDTLVYLDGTVFTPLLGTLRGLTRLPLVIGGAPAGAGATDLFPGRIDELRLWSAVRGEAELTTWARQPVAGGAAGLAGLWRMDEGAGGSLFDAGPAHLEAVLAAPGAQSWSPSDAWRRRVIGVPRALAPFLSGYDADGDPFTATAAVAAGHGLVSFGAGGAAAYDPDTEYGGPDDFTVEVANAGGASRYQTVVEVPSPAACLTDATCSGGGSCVAGACVAPARLRTVGGSYGCATGGAPDGGRRARWAALAALALLALAPRRRRAAAALGLGLLLAALPARAAEGFAVRTVEPAPAGDRFLGVPDAGVAGHLVPSAAIGLGWTEKPLQLQLDGRPVSGGTLIERQLALQLGLSLSLWDRLLVDLSWPIHLIQLEQRPSAGAAPSGSALEDPRLGARVALAGDEQLSLAAGLAAWLPLGEPTRFGSDGTLRLQPSLLAGGRTGAGLRQRGWLADSAATRPPCSPRSGRPPPCAARSGGCCSASGSRSARR